MRSIFLGLLICGAVGAQSARVYEVRPVAGSDWVGDAGPARQALLFQAEGLATDLWGNLYIADAAGNRVRRVSPDGTIETVAGTGKAGSAGDGGPATEAQLKSPYGLAVDSSGQLYIADLGNASIRRVDADGTISTLAGGGAFVEPRNLALDRAGNLYISDFGAHKVYRLSPAGALDTVAGTGVAGFTASTGPAASAQLSHPAGLALDRFGALYIADSGNHLVRKVTSGLIETVAQVATPTGLAFDGFGTLHVADATGGQIVRIPASGSADPLPIPARDVAVGPGGNVYAADGTIVRRRMLNGNTAVFAGGGNTAFGDFGPAVEARLNHPTAVAVDAEGAVYIADRDNHRVRRVSPEGTIETVAGTGMAGDSGDFGPATRASLNTPVAVAVDHAGNLYIADQGNHRIRMVTPGGTMLPVATTIVPSGLAVDDGSGYLYVADQGAGRIYRVEIASGGVSSVIGGLASPAGLAGDGDGNLWITEAAAKRVRKLTPDGLAVTVAPGVWSEPRGVVVTETGEVLVADTGLGQVLRVDDEAGTATPVALDNAIRAPWAIAASGGVLYLAEADANRVESLAPQAAADPIVAIEVVNAANGVTGPLAAGMLIEIRGAQFAGAQVTVAGYPAAVLSSSEGKTVAQAPAEIAGLNTASIEILVDGLTRATVTLPVAPAAPALFADEDGIALATNEDGSLNAAANPAARGSVIVLYGTGQGLAPGTSSVRIGDYPADVLYAGPVSGYPGLFQLNVRVPAGYLAPGRLSVVWSVAGESSQEGVSVYAQ